jgi:hypothetical protein
MVVKKNEKHENNNDNKSGYELTEVDKRLAVAALCALLREVIVLRVEIAERRDETPASRSLRVGGHADMPLHVKQPQQRQPVSDSHTGTVTLTAWHRGQSYGHTLPMKCPR